MTAVAESRTLTAMKTKMLGLTRLPAIQIAPSAVGMYTDPEASAIQRARQELFDALASAREGSLVPLSFAGVELSASCIAAVLGPVLNAIVERHLDGKFVLAFDPTGRNAWDADAGLRKESERAGRKLICVWTRNESEMELVGPVDEQVRTTYGFARQRSISTGEGVTARDLAEQFEISIQAASNRLAKASSLGLLFQADRESVAGGGSQYVFVPIG